MTLWLQDHPEVQSHEMLSVRLISESLRNESTQHQPGQDLFWREEESKGK